MGAFTAALNLIPPPETTNHGSRIKFANSGCMISFGLSEEPIGRVSFQFERSNTFAGLLPPLVWEEVGAGVPVSGIGVVVGLIVGEGVLVSVGFKLGVGVGVLACTELAERVGFGVTVGFTIFAPKTCCVCLCCEKISSDVLNKTLAKRKTLAKTI